MAGLTHNDLKTKGVTVGLRSVAALVSSQPVRVRGWVLTAPATLAAKMIVHDSTAADNAVFSVRAPAGMSSVAMIPDGGFRFENGLHIQRVNTGTTEAVLYQAEAT